MEIQPELTFFCELETPALQSLFDDPALIETLQTMKASISLGLLDRSAGRAAVVRRLNEAGIPVTAWLLLPHSQGYWFNLGNVPQAIAAYDAFRAWTAEERLQWAAVGMDIEPDIREMAHLYHGGAGELVKTWLRRIFPAAYLRRAEMAYNLLADRIHRDGYRLESYQLPWIADERRAGSTLGRQITGLVQIPVDREVLMLYSSLMGAGTIGGYGREAQGIGIGSTGGGVILGDGKPAPAMDWEMLERDLRLARQWTAALYIFSLEGCVEQGFLERLRNFDWDTPVEAPTRAIVKVKATRAVLQGVLWCSAHPWVLLAALLLGVRFLRRRRRI